MHRPAAHRIPDGSYSEIIIGDFAGIFGTTVDSIPDRCRDVIKRSDFRYSVLTGEAREAVFIRVLKALNSDTLKVSGPHRKMDWEKGWTENLQKFQASPSDLHALIPKFVRKKEVIRFQGNYIMPEDQDFETNFVTFLRYYLFGKYFAAASKVYEFGCGTGLNLVAVSEVFPKMELYGLDWSEASCKIVDELAQKTNLRLRSYLFDMFSPDENIGLDNTSAVFTIGAMEQIGTNFEAFTEFILKKRPSVCINIEPIYELDDSNNLFDYLAICYMEKRNYLRGYLEYLKKLEKDRKIDILETRKTFGGLYHDAYSYVVWKPRK